MLLLVTSMRDFTKIVQETDWLRVGRLSFHRLLPWGLAVAFVGASVVVFLVPQIPWNSVTASILSLVVLLLGPLVALAIRRFVSAPVMRFVWWQRVRRRLDDWGYAARNGDAVVLCEVADEEVPSLAVGAWSFSPEQGTLIAAVAAMVSLHGG